MEYEEFVSLHPKLINWSQSWEFIFKYTKPLFDKYNNEWFYRWIGEHADGEDLCGVWDKLHIKWKLIQKWIDGSSVINLGIFLNPVGRNGRLSIFTGKIYHRLFKKHLNDYGLTIQDWIDDYTGIPRSTRVCRICGNQLKFNFEHNCYYATCGDPRCDSEIHSKLLIHLNKTYNSYLNSKWDKFNSPNKSEEEIANHNARLYFIRATQNSYWTQESHPELSEIELDSHNNLIYNRFSKMGEKGGKKAFNYWDKITYPNMSDEEITAHNNSLYNNRKSNYLKLLRAKKVGWHSYPEDLLGDILFQLNLYYIPEYSVIKLESGSYKYRIDYYLPDFNIGVECDGMFKWTSDGTLKDYWLSRKHNIQSNTGIIIKNIPSNDVFYYFHHKRELYNLLIKNDYPLIVTESEKLKFNDYRKAI